MKNFKSKFSRLLLGSFLLFFLVGWDQGTKTLASNHLKDKPDISMLGDTVRLSYTENKGAFLGLGSTLSENMRLVTMLLIPSLAMLAVLGLLIKKWDMPKNSFIAFNLILAGGIGNLIDRFLYSSVVDFLNVGVGWLRTGIFNIADMAILVGVIWLVFLSRESKTPVNSS